MVAPKQQITPVIGLHSFPKWMIPRTFSPVTVRWVRSSLADIVDGRSRKQWWDDLGRALGASLLQHFRTSVFGISS
jgi:hypothetical protein